MLWSFLLRLTGKRKAHLSASAPIKRPACRAPEISCPVSCQRGGWLHWVMLLLTSPSTMDFNTLNQTRWNTHRNTSKIESTKRLCFQRITGAAHTDGMPLTNHSTTKRELCKEKHTMRLLAVRIVRTVSTQWKVFFWPCIMNWLYILTF